MQGPTPGNNDLAEPLAIEMLVEMAGLAQHNLCYTATPYTKYAQGMDQAYMDACEVLWWLNCAGVNTYSPIAYTHPLASVWGVDKANGAFWLDFDQAMMKVCDALVVVMMDGWEESEGVALEIAEFLNAGKPIYTLDPSTLEVTRYESN